MINKESIPIEVQLADPQNGQYRDRYSATIELAGYSEVDPRYSHDIYTEKRAKAAARQRVWDVMYGDLAARVKEARLQIFDLIRNMTYWKGADVQELNAIFDRILEGTEAAPAKVFGFNDLNDIRGSYNPRWGG